MLSKFLDPKNDVAFKRIFGSEKNKDILIHFLNDMITFKGRGRIVDVEFLPNTQDPAVAAQRMSIVDILCRDEHQHVYIVEMQVAKERGFEKRAQLYAAKAYISQMSTKREYYDLQEVIFLAITNFEMFSKKKAYKSDHVIMDLETHENDLKGFSFTFLELPKFHVDIDHLSNMTEKWAYFFKHAGETHERDLPKLVGQDTVIEKAYEELNRFYWNEKELLTYDNAQKHEGIYRACLAQKFDEGEASGIEKGIKRGVEKGLKTGLKKGIKKGIEKGRKEGLQEGLEKGRQEGARNAALKMVEALRARGINLETVAEVAHLSEE